MAMMTKALAAYYSLDMALPTIIFRDTTTTHQKPALVFTIMQMQTKLVNVIKFTFSGKMRNCWIKRRYRELKLVA